MLSPNAQLATVIVTCGCVSMLALAVAVVILAARVFYLEKERDTQLTHLQRSSDKEESLASLYARLIDIIDEHLSWLMSRQSVDDLIEVLREQTSIDEIMADTPPQPVSPTQFEATVQYYLLSLKLAEARVGRLVKAWPSSMYDNSEDWQDILQYAQRRLHQEAEGAQMLI